MLHAVNMLHAAGERTACGSLEETQERKKHKAKQFTLRDLGGGG
jgi:hypothetical protein